ncbi:cholesterol 7-desaturase-like [Centruroides sculpturatus]|uniref:cholesterol 7-desaturase-like n=1 Tax=Centruroides sculpturatus TaxID=218467 RepID=UPI000C6EC498|nr:cholesterol 7-desaturase-like [Centruroides sculpturatus]
MFIFLNDVVTKELCKYSWFLDMFQCIDATIMNKSYLFFLLFVLILIVYFSLSTHNKVVVSKSKQIFEKLYLQSNYFLSMQDMTDIGYNDRRTSASKLYKKRLQLLKETNRSRSPDEIPPAYPNGWITLLESRDLSAGECKPVTAVGQQFVIFRGKTGKSFVLDAYCPHLGANLGIDGKIHEDCIECPFHGWRFSGEDGSCVKIPYTEKVPKAANIKCWETIEQNGFIYVWHHAEGQPPLWKPAVISEIEDGLWHYKGRTEHIKVTFRCASVDKGVKTSKMCGILPMDPGVFTDKDFAPCTVTGMHVHKETQISAVGCGEINKETLSPGGIDAVPSTSRLNDFSSPQKSNHFHKGRLQNKEGGKIKNRRYEEKDTEIMENGSDFAHFDCLHKYGITSGIILHPENWWKFFQNMWKISCSPVCTPNSHCYKYTGNTAVQLFGISVLRTNFEIQVIGPAIIHSYLQSDFGNSVFVQSIINEGPFRQRFIRHYYSPSRFSTLLDHVAMFWESRLIERDVRIWNYKMYLKNPIYVSEDRTIAKFRKWYAQFYSKNSSRAEEKSLNW